VFVAVAACHGLHLVEHLIEPLDRRRAYLLAVLGCVDAKAATPNSVAAAIQGIRSRPVRALAKALFGIGQGVRLIPLLGALQPASQLVVLQKTARLAGDGIRLTAEHQE
jgi:hypothetical protein